MVGLRAAVSEGADLDGCTGTIQFLRGRNIRQQWLLLPHLPPHLKHFDRPLPFSMGGRRQEGGGRKEEQSGWWNQPQGIHIPNQIRAYNARKNPRNFNHCNTWWLPSIPIGRIKQEHGGWLMEIGEKQWKKQTWKMRRRGRRRKRRWRLYQISFTCLDRLLGWHLLLFRGQTLHSGVITVSANKVSTDEQEQHVRASSFHPLDPPINLQLLSASATTSTTITTTSDLTRFHQTDANDFNWRC